MSAQSRRLEYLADLEAGLRGDAAVMRRGSTVRLNLDDAADAVAELRALLKAAA